MRMNEFLNLPMGGKINENMGLKDTTGSKVATTLLPTTTYKDFYKAQYAKFKFPLRNLYKDKTCLAKCPDGFASVDGIC
jgi:hypothetical protein